MSTVVEMVWIGVGFIQEEQCFSAAAVGLKTTSDAITVRPTRRLVTASRWGGPSRLGVSHFTDSRLTWCGSPDTRMLWLVCLMLVPLRVSTRMLTYLSMSLQWEHVG